MFVFLSFLKIQSNQQLTNDIETEQKLNKASRTQIDTLTGEIQELEKSLEDLKQEKSQLLQTRMNDEQDDDRQDLLRHLTQEKVSECHLSLFLIGSLVSPPGSIRTANERSS